MTTRTFIHNIIRTVEDNGKHSPNGDGRSECHKNDEILRGQKVANAEATLFLFIAWFFLFAAIDNSKILPQLNSFEHIPSFAGRYILYVLWPPKYGFGWVPEMPEFENMALIMSTAILRIFKGFAPCYVFILINASHFCRSNIIELAVSTSFARGEHTHSR